MTSAGSALTLHEIARAVEVEPQAVHNWKRRHGNTFPVPSYSADQERYAVSAVASWLRGRLIHRDALKPEEPPGATYGERFAKNLGLPAHDVVPRADDGDAARANEILDKVLWQPLSEYVGASGSAATLEMVLFQLYLRASDPLSWGELTAADPEHVHGKLGKALRKHEIDVLKLAGVRANLTGSLRSGRDLCRIVRIVEQAARAVAGNLDQADGFETAACRFLIDRTASERDGRKSEYFTPPDVARMMVGLVRPNPADRVCDPCCGSGELLVAAGIALRQQSVDTTRPQLSGSALGERSWRLAKLAAAVHGLQVDLGPRPSHPLHGARLPEDRYECVLTNPPFNEENWSEGDPADHGRWPFGAPPAHNANVAWLQHAVSVLTDHGRAVVVMPNSASTGGNARERAVRAALVESRALRCIIALPPRLFRETAVSVSLWVLGRPPRDDRDPPSTGDTRFDDVPLFDDDIFNEVLFIDASSLGDVPDRRYRELGNSAQAHVAEAYHAWAGCRPGEYQGEPGFAAVATVEQVRGRGHDLNPGAYVAMSRSAAQASVSADDTMWAVRELRDTLLRLHDRAADADTAVRAHLERIETWTH